MLYHLVSATGKSGVDQADSIYVDTASDRARKCFYLSRACYSVHYDKPWFKLRPGLD